MKRLVVSTLGILRYGVYGLPFSTLIVTYTIVAGCTADVKVSVCPVVHNDSVTGIWLSALVKSTTIL